MAGRQSAGAEAPRWDAGVADAVSAEIAVLMGKGVEVLRATWVQRFRSPVPLIQSPDMLRRLFAWKLQAEVFGDLDEETVASLKRTRSAVANGKAPSAGASLRAGTILVREWRGVTHRVLALDKGFEHDGRRYGSLSEVARAISGTRWSGPRFFGIEERSPRSKPAMTADGVGV